MGLLDNIESPADIRHFSLEELKRLCAEIREYMIECCATNPGHLASSLGAVELIVGFHYVYDSPSDKIVYDVGHQAYAHKILTGRKDIFRKNRKKDGISGFTRMDESVYDAFGLYKTDYRISADYEFMIRILKDGKVRLSYLPEVLIYMSHGGTSTNSLGAYLAGMKEGHRALRENGVRFAWFTDLCRTLRVLAQFVKKK